jgi:phosphoenolpyruvate synthase/pyruvate phosphate dikinase
MEDVVKLIKRYELKPASKRKEPLFFWACVYKGYVDILEKKFGISYRAVAGISENGFVDNLFNEVEVTRQTERFLQNKDNNIEKVRQELLNNLETFKQEHSKVKGNPEKTINFLTDRYPDYFMIIGFYNCLWRYIGDEHETQLITGEMIKKIQKERDEIAKYYPIVEKDFEDNCKIIAKKDKIDWRLLVEMSINEVKKYMQTRNLDENEKKEINKRIKKYIYFYSSNKELIITDEKTINDVKKEAFNINKELSDIKGFSAYPGKVRGIAYNYYDSKEPKEWDILVISQTHPSEISIVKKAKALVTDEGGILSHACIIARELKIPAIISTKIATKVLKTRDLVEVDADKGIVKILEKKK